MSLETARSPEEQLRDADPVLGAVIDEVARDGEAPTLAPDPTLPADPNKPTDRYGVLVRAIVSQNISETASQAIYLRLLERFRGTPPSPGEILAADLEELRRAVGLSHAKVASLRSLAEHIVSGELELERLHELPDEDVVAQLSAVRGIGPWTADMFLIFHLRRPDVLPVADVGLRRAVMHEYALASPPGPAALKRIAEPWRPNRTLACLYLWQIAAATPLV
jgi:DNA-3-methyladenine glycosylase II